MAQTEQTRITASQIKVGDRLTTEGNPAVVTKVLAGDHSAFARDTGARFWHPDPITVYYTLDGERGHSVFGASEELGIAS